MFENNGAPLIRTAERPNTCGLLSSKSEATLVSPKLSRSETERERHRLRQACWDQHTLLRTQLATIRQSRLLLANALDQQTDSAQRLGKDCKKLAGALALVKGKHGAVHGPKNSSPQDLKKGEPEGFAAAASHSVAGSMSSPSRTLGHRLLASASAAALPDSSRVRSFPSTRAQAEGASPARAMAREKAIVTEPVSAAAAALANLEAKLTPEEVSKRTAVEDQSFAEAVDARCAELRSAIDAEAVRRTEDTATLERGLRAVRQEVEQEARSRSEQQDKLSSSLHQVQTKLEREVSSRGKANAQLGERIDALGTQLASEAKDRTSGDNGLINMVSQVESSPESADDLRIMTRNIISKGFTDGRLDTLLANASLQASSPPMTSGERRGTADASNTNMQGESSSESADDLRVMTRNIVSKGFADGRLDALLAGASLQAGQATDNELRERRFAEDALWQRLQEQSGNSAIECQDYNTGRISVDVGSAEIQNTSVAADMNTDPVAISLQIPVIADATSASPTPSASAVWGEAPVASIDTIARESPQSIDSGYVTDANTQGVDRSVSSRAHRRDAKNAKGNDQLQDAGETCDWTYRIESFAVPAEASAPVNYSGPSENRVGYPSIDTQSRSNIKIEDSRTLAQEVREGTTLDRNSLESADVGSFFAYQDIRSLDRRHPAFPDVALDPLKAQKQLESKRTLLQESRACNGRRHPESLKCAFDLGSFYLAHSCFEEAEDFFREVLGASREVFGDYHENTLKSATNLANALQGQDRLDEAELLLREVLERRTSGLGPKHPDSLRSAFNLGALLRTRGDVLQADPILRDLLEGCWQQFGPQHPNSVRATRELADLVKARGGPALARLRLETL